MELPPIFLNLKPKERDYFVSLAKGLTEKILALHNDPGKLWEKDGAGKDWVNVTEHCLLEAARIGVLADILGLENELRGNLISAAAVHDFNKKEDIRLTREDIAAGGSGRSGALAAEELSGEILCKAGFPDVIISLAGHVSGDPQDVYYMKEILDSSPISPEGLAHLAMHYVDNYTRGSAWAEPAERRGMAVINDVDRRNEMNASNPAYQKMNLEGLALNESHPFFRGMTRFEAAAAMNHLIEKKFTEIIRNRGINIKDSFDLPEFIDERIREDINRKK